MALFTDFYELSMMQGYFKSDIKNKKVVFEVFYRKNPFGNSFTIFAGLDQVIEYISNIRFIKEELDYIKRLGSFDADFIDYLRDFKFNGNIFSMREGSIALPSEPIMVLEGNILELLILEPGILNIINHQTLIATKTNRIIRAADSDPVVEFGLRRAHGPDAALYGSRAAIIGGARATSNVLAGYKFDIPVFGTHAHSWIMSFNNELEAFRSYASVFPDNCILLVDTFDSINSGIPNAIKVFKEMKELGKLKNFGIRLDSGDLAYISKMARYKLDEAGFYEASICASNDLDEFLIKELKSQNACISVWGVGTNLITAKDCPSLGGVYKLVAQTDGISDNYKPCIKISDNIEKITTPGIKKVYRIYDKYTDKIIADYVSLREENIKNNESLTIFDPLAIWKKTNIEADSYMVREMLQPVFIRGISVYNKISVTQIAEYSNREQDTLLDEHKRLINPQPIDVSLSKKLWGLKLGMTNKDVRISIDI
jgi:nicotinate phosphoribosyltransferase